MTNHVHLLLDPGDDVKSIGLLMKRLAGRQTRYVNKQEHRTGLLWEGRYKMSIVDGQAIRRMQVYYRPREFIAQDTSTSKAQCPRV